MAGDAQSVLAAATARLGEVTNENACATFVSQVFKAAGAGSAFPFSGWVPTIVGSFSGAQISNDPQTAMPADLIVFGKNEHIAIYEGSGQVIGTGTGKSGATTVVSVSIGGVIAEPSGLGFSKVLHTNLGGVAAGATNSVADYLGIASSTPFTQDIASKAAAKWSHARVPNGGQAYQGAYNALMGQLAKWVTSPPLTAGQVPINPGGNQGPGGDLVTPSPEEAASGAKVGSLVPDLFGIFGWVPGMVANAAVLVLVVVLAVSGIRRVVDGD